MKRRPQFSIATLLAVVTICAFVAHWHATRHRLALALDELAAAESGREVGAADDRDIYVASVKVLHAEQALPFAGQRDACARHLELMKTLEKRWRALPRVTIIGGDPADFSRECNEKADKIRVWVEEAQRWLDEAS